MFRKLLIKNYILIKKVEINFTEGFNAITGETGAGKSILIGALSLLSGQRAEKQVLRNTEEKCTIEAEIELSTNHLQPLFDSLDLDFEQLTILRREILPSGKSRAFINDTPVNLKTLDLCSKALFDIHSQHQNTLIKSDTFRLSVIDQLANNEENLKLYQKTLKNYIKQKQKIEKLKAENTKLQEEQEFLSFRFEQLQKTDLIVGELEELEKELNELTHAEEIKQVLTKASHLLSESEYAIISQLLSLENELQKINNYHCKTQEFTERVHSNIIDLQDLSSDIESLSEDIEYNPERIDFINERIQTLIDLQRKHKVESVEELISIRDELDNKLQNISNFDFELNTQEKSLNELLQKLEEKSQLLSQKRQSIFSKIEKFVSETLQSIGIPKAIFKVQHRYTNSFENYGSDEILFTFSANTGIQVNDISKIASGGERSRIMLAIKAIQTNKKRLTSLILDEVDTGVSGEIAGKIGELMKKLSKSRQLIVITHLPQIAAKADLHFKVKKQETKENITESTVVQLSNNDRIKEIASLLSGETITKAAKANAMDLLGK